MILFPLLIAFSVFSQAFGESIYKAYVINIASRTNRLKSIKKQLNKYNIPYELFYAITPADLEKEKKLRLKHQSSDKFDPRTKMNFTLTYSEPRPTEISCTQSHIQVLSKIFNSNTRDPVLVLEDDAGFEPDFYNRTVNIIKSIKGKWDVLHVGYCLEQEDKCEVGGERGPDYCKTRIDFIPCSQAYFINGSEGASTVLNNVNTETPQIYDFMLSYASDNYYISLPKLAIQFPFPSDNGNPIDHWIL